jgi:glycerol uptake facilitator protein
VITWAWALAVFMGVLTSVAVDGGVAHLNPAVTLGLAAIDKFDWDLVPLTILCQFIGAFIGALLVWLSYLPHWAETEDQGLKLAVYCTAPGIRNTVANLITEIVGTFMLVFGILAIAPLAFTGGDDMTMSGWLTTGALPVGLLVLVIGLSLGGPTGYAINPARDLGPRIMHFILPIAGKGGSDWVYSWIPVVGPIVGGVLGAVAAKAIFEL